MMGISESKLLVYTTLFGRYDTLKDPSFFYDKCDFICITDQKYLSSHFWKIVYVDIQDPILENRKYKILPHKFFTEYNYSLYVDASIKIRSNPRNLLEKYLADSEMAVCAHPDRGCAYEEINATIATGKCKEKELAIEQYLFYKQKEFPVNFGLFEMGIIFRKHNSIHIKLMMEEWWTQFNKWAKRDQFSIPYVFWVHKYYPNLIDESPRYTNKFFEITPHLSESEKAWYYKIAYFFLYRKNRNFVYHACASIIEYISKIKKK